MKRSKLKVQQKLRNVICKQLKHSKRAAEDNNNSSLKKIKHTYYKRTSSTALISLSLM